MNEKEKILAAALKTKEGRNKLTAAIAKVMFEAASNPGPYRVLFQAAIQAFSSRTSAKVQAAINSMNINGEIYFPDDLPTLRSLN